MSEEYSLPVFRAGRSPVPLLKAQAEYEGAPAGSKLADEQEYVVRAKSVSQVSLPHSNFLKGARFSPDGSCLLTASEDTRLRAFDLPEDAMRHAALCGDAQPDHLAAAADNWASALSVCEGETIYDFAWYPAMTAAEPASCVFASTCRAHPLHLWDACSGALRCSYRAYNAVDEVTAATSLAFSPDGSRLFGGFSRAIRIWDTSRPGREYQQVATFQKGTGGLPGIVSCMNFNPNGSGVLAAGSYSGHAGLYDSRTNELLYLLEGQSRGITQVRFAPDGNFLFTGARASPEIWCWDVRYHSGVVYKLERETRTTNQRIQFDIEPSGRHLATGGQDGRVVIYDLSVGKLVGSFWAASDTINGFEFHPFLPLAATASGQRRFMEDSSSDSEDSRLVAPTPAQRNALLLWRYDHDWMAVSEAAGATEGASPEVQDLAAVSPTDPAAPFEATTGPAGGDIPDVGESTMHEGAAQADAQAENALKREDGEIET